ncbi:MULTISPECIES: FAD-dependent monooxygenase [Streptomyces]|uniref:FAD-dependent monooxygenase n=1 Tax=Streptomyces TaxID=1883 RepID=UPI00163C54BB|nr:MULTISPECIES: FAD-dependent monooxygenase [Streptomyces]MBC2876295.1 FAD-dependent monooxygenase [Streptomyces sp. TYQ1024]UBI35486.1 FAD-dependent monooxygenase [Streptomyces mobaraensis]UKW28078.1 FAD-dependent monooxygenase [Streptomyces sp. TYQ1024]
MPVPDAETETEVLIVGGGPVGLTARALLYRWGVRALLVEKHRALSPFPRSRLVNVRSMEIFHGLGTAAGITAAAFAPEYGRIRFRDTLDGPDFASAAMAGINAPIPESPVRGVVTSQDRLEPLLLGAADGPVRFGTELTALTEDTDGVEALVVDRDSGAGTRVRARHVLGADGAHSTVRRLLGIGTTGPGALGNITTVVFDADLGRWSADRPAGVYFTAHGSFLPLYPEGGWSWFAPTPDDPEHADWAGIVARALGPGAQAGIEVLRVQPWVMHAFVAEKFRHGRVVLAGDAAHAMPIIGGLGMNTGVADAHNLCWKLAGVTHGWAGSGLLDTYAAERRPVAQRTLRQAVANTRLLHRVQQHRQEQIRSGETAPEQVEIPWSEEYFAQLGLVLGAAYRSAAVLTDHATPPEPPGSGTDYVPTAEPGHRLPHLWLAPGRSTLDTLGEWFTVLTPDPAHWERQAGAAAPWPLRVEPLPHEHLDPCRLGPHGALLVRPDGHIGARWHDAPPGGDTLRRALTALSARGRSDTGRPAASI